MPSRILIITGSPLCRNPRVLKEAEASALAGYSTTVLTLPAEARFEDEDEAILRTVHFQRVHAFPRSTPQNPRKLSHFLQRARTRLARELCARLFFSPASALGPVKALLQAARKQDFDLAIGHTEPGLWVAYRLALEGRPVAADFEDWHSQDLLPTDRRGRPLRLLRHIEKELLRRGRFCLTPSQAMARQLAAWSGAEAPRVLRNVFPLQALPAPLLPPAPRPDDEGNLDRWLASLPGPEQATRFVWFSQTVGPGRGLERFLQAAASVKQPWTLTLAGDASDAYRDSLQSLLPPEQRQRLQFVPRMPQSQLHTFLSGFQVGLSLEPPERLNYNLTLTNKVFQYLEAGLAVLMSKTQGQEELLRQWPAVAWLPGEGEADLSRCIQGIVTLPGELAARRAAARSAAELELNWQCEQTRLLREVKRALEP